MTYQQGLYHPLTTRALIAILLYVPHASMLSRNRRTLLNLILQLLELPPVLVTTSSMLEIKSLLISIALPLMDVFLTHLVRRKVTFSTLAAQSSWIMLLVSFTILINTQPLPRRPSSPSISSKTIVIHLVFLSVNMLLITIHSMVLIGLMTARINDNLTSSQVWELIIKIMARGILIHFAMHWPQASSTDLWPFAVDQAIYIWNHLPDNDTKLSPIELFTQAKFHNHHHLQNLHVFDCPVYVLDPTLQDAK
jgi:hypothetical protein